MKAKIGELQLYCPLLAVAVSVAFCAGASQAAPSKSAHTSRLVLPPLSVAASEASVAAEGRAVECVDVRTGALFEYRAQHLLSSGAIEESWAPDSSQLCHGSTEGIREHAIPDGSGGAYLAWVDSRLDEPDIYLQRFTAFADTIPGWPIGGLPVCTARLSQYNLDGCPDSQGGAFLVWQDFRDGRSSFIYAQRVTPGGSPASGWPDGGLPLGGAGSEQAVPRVAADGTGGCVVFWQERGPAGLALRAQHVTSSGANASGWPSSGVTLVPAGQQVIGINVSGDGSGRVTVAWRSAHDPSGIKLEVASLDVGTVPDSSWAALPLTLTSQASLISDVTLLRPAGGDLLAAWSEMTAGQATVKLTKLTAAGSLAPGWLPTGTVVAASDAGLSAPALLPDGSGGAIVAWVDRRSGAGGDIYAQRVHGDGTIDSLWTQGGVPVATGGPDQFAPILAPDGNGGTIVTWSDDQSETVAGYLSAQLERMEGAPQLLRVETNTGYARLVWSAGRSAGATIHGYRASASGAWELLATIAPDDSSHLVLEDRAAPEGQEVEYRLSIETGGAGYFLSPVRVAIPVGPDKLVLQRAWAAPGRDAIQIAFALPRGPAARVEVFDVLGRRVAEESLAQFTPGYYTHRVPFRGRAVSGIYFVRLSQGGVISARRLSFLR